MVNELSEAFHVTSAANITFNPRFVNSRVYMMFSNTVQGRNNFIYDGKTTTYFDSKEYDYRALYFDLYEADAKVFINGVKPETYCFLWIEEASKATKCSDYPLMITGGDYLIEITSFPFPYQLCVFLPTTLTTLNTEIHWGYSAVSKKPATLYYLNQSKMVDSIETDHENTTEMNNPFYIQFDTSSFKQIFIERKRDLTWLTNFDDCNRSFFLQVKNGKSTYMPLVFTYDEFSCLPSSNIWEHLLGLWISVIVAIVVAIVVILMIVCGCCSCCGIVAGCCACFHYSNKDYNQPNSHHKHHHHKNRNDVDFDTINNQEQFIPSASEYPMYNGGSQQQYTQPLNPHYQPPYPTQQMYPPQNAQVYSQYPQNPYNV